MTPLQTTSKDSSQASSSQPPTDNLPLIDDPIIFDEPSASSTQVVITQDKTVPANIQDLSIIPATQESNPTNSARSLHIRGAPHIEGVRLDGDKVLASKLNVDQTAPVNAKVILARRVVSYNFIFIFLIFDCYRKLK